MPTTMPEMTPILAAKSGEIQPTANCALFSSVMSILAKKTQAMATPKTSVRPAEIQVDIFSSWCGFSESFFFIRSDMMPSTQATRPPAAKTSGKLIMAATMVLLTSTW